MENKKEKSSKSNKQLLLEYSGFAFTLMASAGIATYFGLKLDDWVQFDFPVFVWLLPFIIIVILIFKAIKDTSK